MRDQKREKGTPRNTLSTVWDMDLLPYDVSLRAFLDFFVRNDPRKSNSGNVVWEKQVSIKICRLGRNSRSFFDSSKGT